MNDGKKDVRKQSGVRLSPAMLKQLKHLSVDLDRSNNSLVEEAIQDLLKKYGVNVNIVVESRAKVI